MAKIPVTEPADNSPTNNAPSTRASNDPPPGETDDGQEPDWVEYRGRKRLSVQEAVALSLGIRLDESEYYGGAPPPSTEEKLIAEFQKRVRLACSHIQDGSLPARERPSDSDTLSNLPRIWEVKVGGFRVFATMKGWRLPPQFPQEPDGIPASWPWGMHTTKLLRHLAAAATEFWATKYQPGLPATAPASVDVTAWLIQQGVAKRVAQVMAQMLRADDLPPGPHNNK